MWSTWSVYRPFHQTYKINLHGAGCLGLLEEAVVQWQAGNTPLPDLQDQLLGSLLYIHCLRSKLCSEKSGFYTGKQQNLHIQVLCLIKEMLHATFLLFFLFSLLLRNIQGLNSRLHGAREREALCYLVQDVSLTDSGSKLFCNSDDVKLELW